MQIKFEEHKVDNKALCACLILQQTRREKFELEKDVNNDDLMGIIGCIKEKNSRQIIEALFSTFTESSLTVALKTESYIKKWSSMEAVELKHQNNSPERNWARHSEIFFQ